MNRTTFLFLALLIASCILTVHSRHETRTVITEKAVLTERVNTLQETIRRLELEQARLVAKKVDEDVPEPAPAGKPGAPVKAAEKPAAEKSAAAPAKVAVPAATPKPVAAKH
jgi:cell division protein FtsL